MPYVKATNKETGEAYKVLINTRAISAEQMKLVNEIIAYYDAKEDASEEDKARYAARKYRRNEMFLAHQALRGKKSAPYFITKNRASNPLNSHGTINLNVFKLRAGEPAEAAEPDATPKKSKKSKKNGAAVKAKSNRKGAKKHAPAGEPATETTETEVHASE